MCQFSPSYQIQPIISLSCPRQLPQYECGVRRVRDNNCVGGSRGSPQQPAEQGVRSQQLQPGSQVDHSLYLESNKKVTRTSRDLGTLHHMIIVAFVELFLCTNMLQIENYLNIQVFIQINSDICSSKSV